MLELQTRSGLLAGQQPNELAAFIALLNREGVTSYLEIGSRHGDTFFDVMKSLPQGSKGVAVDMPLGPWGSNSRPNLLNAIKSLPDYDVRAVFGDSREVVDEVLSYGPFDAVLIDADHRYEAVKKDYENYGGSRIVAFHDIDGHGIICGGMVMGVPEFWREIRYNYTEIIDPTDKSRPMGIGVIIN